MITTINEFKDQNLSNDIDNVYHLGKNWKKSTIGPGVYKQSVILYDVYHKALSKLSKEDQEIVKAKVDNIDKSKLYNESTNNLLAQNGAINPTKKQIFTKTSFQPQFEVNLYNELKRILPHGYTFDCNMWGNRNFLLITNTEGYTFKFSLGENTSIYKIKNIIKQKINISETLLNDNNNYILEDIIDLFMNKSMLNDSEYHLDNDDITLLLYIPANNLKFDITNPNFYKSDIFNTLNTSFNDFCKNHNLYEQELTVTSDYFDLVFSAKTDIIDKR